MLSHKKKNKLKAFKNTEKPQKYKYLYQFVKNDMAYLSK